MRWFRMRRQRVHQLSTSPATRRSFGIFWIRISVPASPPLAWTIVCARACARRRTLAPLESAGTLHLNVGLDFGPRQFLVILFSAGFARVGTKANGGADFGLNGRKH